jgi:glutamyl-tRNA synthetase
VVSVTTYRDAGFLPQAYINFLCLLGWSPKNNREQMAIPELIEAFSFSGVNRSNAVVNFSDEDPIDPKAQWLNGQHLRSMALDGLLPAVRATLEAAGLHAEEANFAFVIDTIRARYTSLHDFATKGLPYFSTLGDRLAAATEFTEASVETALRELAAEAGVKPGVLINGSRAALTGQAVGPSAFHVFTAIGRERSIARLKKV